MSFNIHPTQGCFYLKMLLFCYGHPCIYESFCCHMLICTIIVFDIANYCMSSDGKRLSSLKKRQTSKQSQSSYRNLGEPAVSRPSGASAFSSPHHPSPAASTCSLRAGCYRKAFWGKSCLNCNCQMHCAELYPLSISFA